MREWRRVAEQASCNVLLSCQRKAQKNCLPLVYFEDGERKDSASSERAWQKFKGPRRFSALSRIHSGSVSRLVGGNHSPLAQAPPPASHSANQEQPLTQAARNDDIQVWDLNLDDIVPALRSLFVPTATPRLCRSVRRRPTAWPHTPTTRTGSSSPS